MRPVLQMSCTGLIFRRPLTYDPGPQGDYRVRFELALAHGDAG